MKPRNESHIHLHNREKVAKSGASVYPRHIRTYIRSSLVRHILTMITFFLRDNFCCHCRKVKKTDFAYFEKHSSFFLWVCFAWDLRTTTYIVCYYWDKIFLANSQKGMGPRKWRLECRLNQLSKTDGCESSVRTKQLQKKIKKIFWQKLRNLMHQILCLQIRIKCWLSVFYKIRVGRCRLVLKNFKLTENMKR